MILNNTYTYTNNTIIVIIGSTTPNPMNPATEQVNPQALYTNIPQSIIATFKTHLSQYQLQSSQQQQLQIDISTELDEQALNKIVKQMLEATLDQQSIDRVNFDFLVNGSLLRGRIKSHMVRYDISPEQVINIQYFIAFHEFKDMKEQPVEDWISSICQVLGVQSNIGVISAQFNGTITYHPVPSPKTAPIPHKTHPSIIKSIKCLPSEQQNTYYIIAGGIDEELSVSRLKVGSNSNVEAKLDIISNNEHKCSILGIDYNRALDGLVCTAGGDGRLRIWKIPADFLDQEFNQKVEKKKKRKTNNKNLPLLSQMSIHQGPINSVCWLTGSSVATGSSDHSIKLTNIQKQKQMRVYLTRDSITTSIDFSNNTLFTTHEDGYIRTWDVRSQQTTPSQTYKSHSRFASCIRTHTHSNIFCSASYDGTVKIWDTRSVFPLQTLMTQYEKVFTLCWKSQGMLAAGGAGAYLSFYSI